MADWSEFDKVLEDAMEANRDSEKQFWRAAAIILVLLLIAAIFGG